MTEDGQCMRLSGFRSVILNSMGFRMSNVDSVFLSFLCSNAVNESIRFDNIILFMTPVAGGDVVARCGTNTSDNCQCPAALDCAECIASVSTVSGGIVGTPVSSGKLL